MKPILLLFFAICGFSLISTKAVPNLKAWRFDPVFSLALTVVLVPQSCPTLCDPMDCSPPGSSVHGIPQVWILEWGALSFSTGSSWPTENPLQADSLPSEPQGPGYLLCVVCVGGSMCLISIFFTCRYSAVPVWFIEKTALSTLNSPDSLVKNQLITGIPWGSSGQEFTNAGDTDSIPGQGRFHMGRGS